jgi:hypothetical protein
MRWHGGRWLVPLCVCAGAILISSTSFAQISTPSGKYAGTAGASCAGLGQQYAWPDANGQVLQCVSNVWTLVSQTAGAAGSTGQVQFNNAGALGASSNFFWDNTNNRLGIGTTAPVVKLDVIGTSVAAGSIGTEDEFHITRLVNSGVSYPQLASFQLGSYAANGGGNGYGPSTRLDINLKAAANSTLTGDTNIMTLLSNGNVGIGTTVAAARLTVVDGGANVLIDGTSGYGGISFMPTWDTINYSLLGDGASNTFLNAPTSGTINFRVGNVGVATMTTSALDLYAANLVTTSGSVGIGTASPRAPLEFGSLIGAPTPLGSAVAAGGNESMILSNSSNRTVGAAIGITTDGTSYDTYIQARYLLAGPYAYNLLLNPLGGSVGIGTTAPLAFSHVAGTLTSPSAGPVGYFNSSDIGSELYAYTGALSQVTAAPTGDTDSHTFLTGMTGRVDQPATNAHSVINSYGVQGIVTNESTTGSNGSYLASAGIGGEAYNTGNTTLVEGVSAWAESDSGNVADVIGVLSEAPVIGGTVTNLIGLGAWARIAGGTVTNRYGIYIWDAGGSATNDYGIYQVATYQKNYFGGNVGIGTATIANKLDVNGAESIGYKNTTAPTNGLLVSGEVGIGTSTTVNDLDVYGAAAFGNYAGQTAPSGGMILSGNVGIGTTNPMSKLQVNGGEVQIGSSGASCSASNAGAMRYSGGTLYYCNSSVWTASSAGGVAGAAGSTGQVQFNNSGALGASSNFFWDNTNHWLGIETAAPASIFQVGTAGQAVYISGTPVAAGDNYQKAIGFNGYWDGSNWHFPGDGVHNSGFVFAQSNNSNLNLYYASNTGGTDQTFSEAAVNTAMTIGFMNGYVGIGTTAPSNNLHVYTTTLANGISIDGTNAPALAVLNSGTAKGYFGLATTGGDWDSAAAANDIVIVSLGGAIRFNTNSGTGTSPLTILGSNGNVGIGMTTPQVALDLGDSGSWISTQDNVAGSTSSSGITWYYPAPTTFGIYRTAGAWSTPNFQQLEISFATGIIIDGGSTYGRSGTVLQPNGGNVGIGTTSPLTLLTVGGNYGAGNTNVIQLGTGLTALNADLGINFAGTNVGIYNTYTAYSAGTAYDGLKFTTDNFGSQVTAMTIVGNGSVGIGTSTPANRLDVYGGAAIGSYAGTVAPTNGIIVSGEVGIGTAVTANDLDVFGAAAFGTYAGKAAPTGGMIISGNVGIGTNNPVSSLHIYGTGASTALMIDNEKGSAGGTSTLQFGLNNGSFFTNNAAQISSRVISASVMAMDFNTWHGGLTTDMTLSNGQLKVNGGEGAYNYNNASFALGFSTTGQYPNFIHSRHNAGYSTGNAIDFYTSDGTAAGVYPTNAVLGMTITNGTVGIGTTAPAYLLHVGSASASGTVMELQNSSGACTFAPGTSSLATTCSSDERLKANIHDTDDALPWLADMRVRDFTVKATGESSTGVIAQEMLVNHPDMVRANSEGFYGVEVPNPWKMIKALQELKTTNDSLKAANDTLQVEAASLKAANDNEAAEIKELRERLDALEGARP